MSLISKIARVALKPSVAIGNAISNAIKPGSGKTTSAQLASTTAGKVLGTAIAATGAGLAVAAVPAAAAVSVAKSAGSSIAKTAAANPIKTAIAVPIAIGVLSSDPTAPIKATGQLAQFGSDIGSFTKDPSLESGKEIISNSPLISTALATAGLVTVGKGVLPAIASIENTRAIRENTDVRSMYPSMPAYSPLPVLDQSDATAPKITQSEIPQEISAQGIRTPVKRRKSRLQPRSQSISQRVDVRVGVNAANKKYIRMAQYH